MTILKNKKGFLLLTILGCFFAFIQSANAQTFGDDLGNHRADSTLRMTNNFIIDAKGIVIGSSTFINETSVALQIESASKALLVSRVFAPSAILSPVNGMLIYSTSDNVFYARQNNAWIAFGSFTNGVTTLNGLLGSVTIKADSNTASITITNVTSTGEIVVSANAASAIWNANKLMGNIISGSVPSNGQVLQWNNSTSQWEPTTISTLSNLQLGTGSATDSMVTTKNGVLLTRAANNFIYVTDTTGMLSKYLRKSDTASMLITRLKISDTANMLSGYVRSGNVPATGVTSVSVTSANGVSGTVTNATTTPAITLILGAISPTSINSSGSITATSLGGTLSTPAQPNITSTGTLTGLTVTAPINAAITGNAGTATQLTSVRSFNMIVTLKAK